MNNEKRSIDPETLRRWMDEGREVTVLDIRKAADRAEWSIPGSVHFDAYDALKANDPAALANVSLPGGVPVVTVCGLGKTAQVAAEHLAARGMEAMALEGGMKAWSGAWNHAEVALSDGARIIQLRRTGKGCLSYLIGSEGAAAVIDASLDPRSILNPPKVMAGKSRMSWKPTFMPIICRARVCWRGKATRNSTCHSKTAFLSRLRRSAMETRFRSDSSLFRRCERRATRLRAHVTCWEERESQIGSNASM